MEQSPDNSAPRRVEAYLDQVLAPLNRRLSKFHQQELRREMRAHLRERITAYQELGMTEDDAVTEALRQFGGAEDFLKQWRREWLTVNQSSDWTDTLRTAQSALRLFLPALLLTWGCGVLCRFVSLPASAAPALRMFADKQWPEIGGLLFGLYFVVLPGIVGLSAGRHSPRRGGLGIVAALGVLAVFGNLLNGTDQWAWSDQLIWNGFLDTVHDTVNLLPAVWLPTAFAAATLSGWWIQRRKKVLA